MLCFTADGMLERAAWDGPNVRAPQIVLLQGQRHEAHLSAFLPRPLQGMVDVRGLCSLI